MRSWPIAIPWGVLAIGAMAIVVAASFDTVGATDLGCSKSGTTGHEGFSCADPITDLVGWWPFVLMALFLAGPPAVAATLRRVWVSWLAVVALGAVGVWGVGHWAGEWSTLILGLPLAVLAAAVAVAHTLAVVVGRRAAA